MLETLRRYWIAMLVLVMIGLHASIVGLIRYQASMAKIDASCEVDLGNYLAFQTGRQAAISMRLYAIVPINHRMKSRQLIELNQAQIRQSLEEHLRQIDSRVLTDPYLADLKSQLLDVMVQTIGNSSIDDLVITELHEPKGAANLEFVSRGAPHTPRQLVATLRAQNGDSESEEHDDSHGDGEDEGHGESSDHGDENSHESSQSSAHKTSGHAPLKSSTHGASKSSSHGAAKSSSHGAAKSSGHGVSKSSGHGAAKASNHGASAHGSSGHGSSGHGSSGHGASSSKKPAAKSGH